MVWLVFKSTLCKSVQLEVPVTEKVITSEAPKLPKLVAISLAVPDTVAVITPVCPVAPAILFSWVKPLLEVVIELSVKVIATLLSPVTRAWAAVSNAFASVVKFSKESRSAPVTWTALSVAALAVLYWARVALSVIVIPIVALLLSCVIDNKSVTSEVASIVAVTFPVVPEAALLRALIFPAAVKVPVIFIATSGSSVIAVL